MRLKAILSLVAGGLNYALVLRMERRWLVLILALFCIFAYSSAWGNNVYLSNRQKALITLSLKIALHPEKVPAQISNYMQTVQAATGAPEKVSVNVQSFAHFIEMQRNEQLFNEKKLQQVTFEELQALLTEKQYLASSTDVQDQIDEYLIRKREIEISYLAALGNIVTENGLSASKQPSQSVIVRMANKINTVVDGYTQSFLLHSASSEVMLLAKLLKSYFKALPPAQKAEIFYRLIQLPITANPTDLFLTLLQHSGPQMQKLVQIMGRSSHVPKDFQVIFQHLESQVQSVPWWEVKKIIESEISLDNFVTIDKKPLGVGTMAQTHRVEMRDSSGNVESRVIRFLKPDMQRLLDMDHTILLKISKDLDADLDFKKYNLPSLEKLVNDIHAAVVEELVLADTVKNQRVAKGVYTSSQIIQFSAQKNELRIHVPQTSLIGRNKNLMMQELVFGKKPANAIADYQELYPELYRVAAEKISEQWLEHVFFKSGFFHADLHQGNLLMQVLDEHIQVNILDFGMVGQLSAFQQKHILLLPLGLKLKQVDVVTDSFANLSREELSPAKKASLREFIQKKMLQTDDSVSIEEWTKAVIKHGVELQYEFIKLNRGLLAIQSLLQDAKSPIDIETLTTRIALRNKAYVLSLVASTPKITFADLIRLGLQERKSPTDVTAIKCSALF